jgi:hypothetical protein
MEARNGHGAQGHQPGRMRLGDSEAIARPTPVLRPSKLTQAKQNRALTRTKKKELSA